MDEKDQTDICQSDIYQTDICRAEKKYIDSLLRLQDPGSQCEYLLTVSYTHLTLPTNSLV